MRSLAWVGLATAVALFAGSGCGGRVVDPGDEGTNGGNGSAGAGGRSGSSNSPGSGASGTQVPPPAQPTSSPPAMPPSAGPPPIGPTMPPPIGPTMPPPPPPIVDASVDATVPPAIAPVDGAVPDYVLATVNANGLLVAAYQKGADVILVTLDPFTARETYVGTFSSLTGWNRRLAYDPASLTVYAAGYDHEHHYSIFSLTLWGGPSQQRELPTPDGGSVEYQLAGVTVFGQLVAAYWDGTAEQVVLISLFRNVDIAPVAALGDLQYWKNQLVFEQGEDRLYAIGTNHGKQDRLYELEVNTKELRVFPLAETAGDPGTIHGSAQNYVIAGLVDDGPLFATYWNGASEGIARIETASGATDNVGTIMQLTSWSDKVVLDELRGVLYALGTDASNTTRIYSASTSIAR